MSMNWINFQNTYKKNKKKNLSFDGTLILKDRKKIIFSCFRVHLEKLNTTIFQV